MRNMLLSAVVGCLLACATTVASATTLVSVAADRTVVRDGDFFLSFLDLTLTQGDTPAEALANPAATGFQIANFSQVSALFRAFGITLPADPFRRTTTFTASDAQVLAFGNALGFTTPRDRFGNFAVSGLFDGRYAFGTQIRLANAGSPGTPNFISNQNNRDGNGSIGVFMVEVAAVPLPAAGWMLLAGMGGLALMRRRARA